jgi:hypothetical protein
MSATWRMSVSADQGREVIEFLQAAGVRSILVGGLAVRMRGGRATDDVDLLVTAREFRDLKTRLGRSRRIRSYGQSEGVAHFFFRLASGQTEIRVDVLDPSKFAGPHSGDELFDFVWNECSDSLEIGRVARPEFVWYTRLLVDRDIYRDRIAEDLENQSPVEWLDKAVSIGVRFGTGHLARSRAADVLRLADEFGILGRERPSSASKRRNP